VSSRVASIHLAPGSRLPGARWMEATREDTVRPYGQCGRGPSGSAGM